MLSPSNKRFGSVGWRQYCRKRQAHLEGYANFIEIDLLRGGNRMPMEDDWPDSPYYLLACRKKEAPQCTVWPAHFREALPPISVPLAAPDPDLPLAIQPLIDAVYARSRYSELLDYAKPLRPSLDAKEAAWVAKKLKEWRAGR